MINFLRIFSISRVSLHMKPLSDDPLTNVLARWNAPEPPPGLVAGVWARVDHRRPTWLEQRWAFRLAMGLTVVLWLVAITLPQRIATGRASESLSAALARAGSVR